MSALKQKQAVRTNTTKDSVCKIDVPPVKFQKLWDNYQSGAPYVDANGKVPPGYENQCAIRLSATLHKAGVEMKSFSKANVAVKPGTVFGRIMLNGKYVAVRADQMGSWLSKQPFCGLPQQPDNVTGGNWEEKVRRRTGIIMFDSYWSRDGQAGADGGHIDLWNGSRLTINSAQGLIAVIGRRIGIRSARLPGTNIGYSDLSKAKSILFWEIK